MSSPFQKKFCGKSPFKQEDPKEESLLTGTVFEPIPTIKEIKNRFNLGIDQAQDKVDSLKKIDPVVKVVTAPRKKRKSLEHIGEEFFNFPQEKARRRTDGYLDIIPDEDKPFSKIFNKNKKELLLSDYNSLETKKLHAAAQIAQEGALKEINNYLFFAKKLVNHAEQIIKKNPINNK